MNVADLRSSARLLRTPDAARSLMDGHGRTFRKLRVSLTPACNFRCIYCRPAEAMPVPRREQLLSFDEIIRVCRVGVGFGINRIRLTGGEPLVRPGVPTLVRRLHAEAGVENIGMTTNASLLAPQAKALADAGLAGVNVSLDSVNRDVAATIARGDVLDDVLAGIAAALDAGLPVKLNTVVMPGVNDADADLAALCSYAAELNLPLRFIEYMPMGLSGVANGGTAATITAAQLRRKLANVGINLAQTERDDPADPASPWVDAAGNVIGFIHSISDAFCGTCDRMRLTAEGGLCPCLHQDAEVDLRAVLRSDVSDADVRAAFADAAAMKWAGHRMNDVVPLTVRREMVTIGG